ncbi:Clustered mitochondria protein [Linum grandiflorum]
MAGKTNKGKNKRGTVTTAVSASDSVVSTAPVKEDVTVVEPADVEQTNGIVAVDEPSDDKPEAKEPESADADGEPKQQGDLHLFAVPVKTESGEKLELQLNPGDSVMDIRQFLLDAPETCFITCYDLLLHTKDGSSHQLEDYNEVSEVADITTGGCSLEMVAAPYDDRSIRAHVHRTRELISVSTLHSSLSTSLALEYEATQNKPLASDAVKPEVPELDGLGFMENASDSVGKLLSSPSKEVKCVERIVFSSFNPPPNYRRLVGDLIYLDVVTLEGNKFCITGSTKTFYVNSSAGNVLDPKPGKSTVEATTLIALLHKISSKFQKAFHELLEKKASAHPFENVQSLLPPNSWLGLHPVPSHRRDAARAEDVINLSYGSELIGMQRDWNEELQSCREFPHTSPQERILRDRALYKVTSDFVDAAVSGAIGVISRCIPPINPTDPECFHMYVHNNIFFSFAVDADLEQVSKKRTSDINAKKDTNSTPSSEKVPNNVSHGDESVSSVEKTDGSISLESNGSTEMTSPETQLAESEQATYASANNDLKGTKAYQEADVPGLYNLAMAIIDYRGHRVVAQSVLPGILQGDKSESLLYGSVDNGKKICWNEDFHSKVVEAAKRLHLKEHSVLDGSGNSFKLAAPVECKGIVGSDDRHYLLDLMRVTPRDANYTGPGSRFCILRPELISAFSQAEALEKSKAKTKTEPEAPAIEDSTEVAVSGEKEKSATSTDDQELAEEKTDTTIEHPAVPAVSSELDDEILFNPNVLTEFKLAGDPEEITKDEENVRRVGSFLADIVLPKFIQDLCTLEVSPMDGQTLTEALHAHGVNVRYLGRIAEGTKHLPHLWDLCSNEIVVRSAKHVLKDLLRDVEDHELGPAISHYFNCLFGNCQAVDAKTSTDSSLTRSPKKESSGKSKGQIMVKGAPRKNQSSYMNIGSEALWSEIREFAKLKYQFDLPEDSAVRVRKVSVIRNLCQKVGITIAARKYDFNAATPFQTSDILDLRPVVKHSVPLCSEAKELVETGKAQLAEGLLSEAYTLFSEAFSILQQVTGPMHREVANCCRYLAMVLYHAGDMAGAIIQQHKELIINERCLGLDHPDTAHSYGNMALFYHGLNQTELALRHMSRALLLLSLSSGPDHPDVAATFINVAMMFQDMGKMNTALRYLQEALTKNERLLGQEHIQTAVCYHALAIACNCMGAFKLSHQHEKRTYDILAKQLGDEDSRTRDSLNWMKTFKMRELQMNAQKQKGQAMNAASAQKAMDILKANPDLMQAFQAAATGASGSGSNPSFNKSLNAALTGEPLPRGRGVDERAGRAAAEIRRKAAARGLLIRPHGVPVQAMPSMQQQPVNITNSADTAAVVDGEKTKANGVGQQQAPVGLGKGLSSLDSKKGKAKSKAAA